MAMDLSLDNAVFTRASEAFNPDTGERVRDNVLRRIPARMRVCRFPLTKVFHDFPPSTARMTYSQLVAREAAFEAAHPEVTRGSYGTSYNGRDLVWFSYGDTSKPTIIIALGCHGNEVDGSEGAFSFFDDLINDTHGEYAQFKEQFSFVLLPSMNPDGHFSNLRNLASVGPNGLTENLNRCFNWFWDSYIETSAESKGAAPAGEPGAPVEATALYNFLLDPAWNFVAFQDHHQNIGQGHRYMSRMRNNAPHPDYQGRDWEIWRLQGAIRKQRGAEQDPEFCQLRRSKGVPHLHSWCSGILGLFALACESRKDEPHGARASSEWVYDSTLAFVVGMTDVCWEVKDTVYIERAATNLVTNIEWLTWLTANTKPSGYTTSRFTGEPDLQELFPHNNGRAYKGVNELAVDPEEASEDWEAICLGSTIIAVGRKADATLQSMVLATETVTTGPGTGGASPNGANRRFGMVFSTSLVAYCAGGWSEDGLTLNSDDFSVDINGVQLLSLRPGKLPIPLADMGYATDSSRYTVFVGGTTTPVSSTFVGALTGKIILYDATTGIYTDTGLSIPARKHCAVAHQKGTDKFWIFGGEGATGPLSAKNDIWVYDRLAGTVTQAAAYLPHHGVTQLAAAGFEADAIYIYGGKAVTDITTPVYTNLPGAMLFTPSALTLAHVDITANTDDEAVHDDSFYTDRCILQTAVPRLDAGADGDEIFLLGGKVGVDGSEIPNIDGIKVHRPDSDVITFARDGIYSLFSRSEDISGSVGQWFSISSWAKVDQTNSRFFHRAAITFKKSSTAWGHHARTYYEIPRTDKYQWFRAAGKLKTGEISMRAYLRGYTHAEGVHYDRWMACARTRPSTYHPTTRADETLVFQEALHPNYLKIKFLYSPTFGFINVGEDLEIARFQIDSNNYLALVLEQGVAGKNYNSSQNFTGPAEPKVSLRKYRAGVLEAELKLTLYYGYDLRGSNQTESYDDPVEFYIEHIGGKRISFGIMRFGVLGWTSLVDAASIGLFTGTEGLFRFNGEGYYGVPEVDYSPKFQDPIQALGAEMSDMGYPASDCIFPGEIVAT